MNIIRKMKGKIHIVNKKFIDLPKETDFTLKEEVLPDLKDGEFLAEAVYLSVDPYMRAFIPRDGVGRSLFAEQVARILESKNAKYPVGKYVIGEFGWRTHTVGREEMSEFFPFTPRLVPEDDFQPLSLALGILGMPGNTAYFGFLDLCKPEEGNIVLVTTAAGTVGSHVGQLAKMKKCHVIGLTGTDEKCQWIEKELRFDTVINYKKADFEKKLLSATPNGVDIFFDNVGGKLAEKIYKRMKNGGKVAMCGQISTYNSDSPYIPTAPPEKKLSMLEVNVFSYKNRWNEAIDQNRIWVKEGKLQYREEITRGFENMPKIFISMLQGGNNGKAIIEV